MTKTVLLGIDLGTTVLKVCAFDARTGDVLAQASKRLPVKACADGGREQSPATIDRAFRSIVKDLQHRLGTAWSRVAGIGLAAQGGSSIIAGRATGKALTPMVLWNDGRAHAQAASIEAKTGRAFWQEHTLRDFAPHGLARMLWRKERAPSLFRDDTIHIGAGEYLFFRLTGIWRQDPGNAIQIGSYNAVTKQPHQTVFDLIDVPLSFVAPLRQGHETAALSKAGARLLGLPDGLPVAGPYIDQEAGYLSAAGVSKRPLQCSLGTAWVGNFAVPDDVDPHSPLHLILPNPAGQGRLVVLPLLTGNTSWDWALDTLVDSNRAKALKQAAKTFSKTPLPPPGLVALPYLAQRNLLDPGAHGGGVFFGVSTNTSRSDLLRAVVAGMAFEFARVFLPIAQSRAIDSLVLGGGASKGPQFRSLLAALFAPLPVYQQLDEDLAAARGSTFAMNTRVAHSRTQRVKLTERSLANEIRARLDEYLLFFDVMTEAASTQTTP